MGLVTLDQAKEHLKPPGDIDDTRIERLIEEASQIVLDYIKLPSDAYQSTSFSPNEDEVPPQVRAATLLVLGALYDNGDGQDPDKNPISPAVISILTPKRTPTLA
jgi:hypothetical protein